MSFLVVGLPEELKLLLQLHSTDRLPGSEHIFPLSPFFDEPGHGHVLRDEEQTQSDSFVHPSTKSHFVTLKHIAPNLFVTRARTDTESTSTSGSNYTKKDELLCITFLKHSAMYS